MKHCRYHLHNTACHMCLCHKKLRIVACTAEILPGYFRIHHSNAISSPQLVLALSSLRPTASAVHAPGRHPLSPFPIFFCVSERLLLTSLFVASLFFDASIACCLKRDNADGVCAELPVTGLAVD